MRRSRCVGCGGAAKLCWRTLTACWSTAVQVGPEDAVVAHQDIAAALALLTDRQRAVVVLRYYEGLSEAEIADVLGIRPGSVKGHARAGLAALGARLSVDFLKEDRL